MKTGTCTFTDMGGHTHEVVWKLSDKERTFAVRELRKEAKTVTVRKLEFCEKSKPGVVTQETDWVTDISSEEAAFFDNNDGKKMKSLLAVKLFKVYYQQADIWHSVEKNGGWPIDNK